MFDAAYAQKALKALEEQGVAMSTGLRDEDLVRIEHAFDCTLAPELRMLLTTHVPTGGEWVDWSRDAREIADESRGWIARAFEFDIRQNQYWLEDFGPRPDDRDEAVRAALEVVATWPRLMPIHGHRFMPTAPQGPGNPVLSVYQAVDSIYYGRDLADYLHKEFEIERPSWSRADYAHVPKWGTAFDLLCERA